MCGLLFGDYNMVKSFVQWIGGKGRLLSDIKANSPRNINRYFEPFIGGGAVFFNTECRESFISDYNEELINTYKMVRDCPYELIEDLNRHVNTEDYYYTIRGLDRCATYTNLTNIERASRFMYLNKTGYNGIYRVNKKGQNNVPYGHFKNPTIVNSDRILECSKLLQEAHISIGDFENIKPHLRSGDFVYFDPPYVPTSDTSSFTSYTKLGFGNSMQERLKLLCDYIDNIGARFLLSNSHCEYVNDLYRDYEILTVQCNRTINSKKEKRGKVDEVLIKNY